MPQHASHFKREDETDRLIWFTDDWCTAVGCFLETRERLCIITQVRSSPLRKPLQLNRLRVDESEVGSKRTRSTNPDSESDVVLKSHCRFESPTKRAKWKLESAETRSTVTVTDGDTSMDHGSEDMEGDADTSGSSSQLVGDALDSEFHSAEPMELEEAAADNSMESNSEPDIDEPLQEATLFPDAARIELEAANLQITSIFSPFLLWLCSPPLTEAERLVKARRMDPKSLPPVRKNLAFIVKCLLGDKIVELPQLKLEAFTQNDVCEKLNKHLESREVGASRIYALFLLVKKVLVYLACAESIRRREYILPNTWNSWTLVDTLCSDSNTARKQISRNVKVLGAAHCKNLPAVPVRTALTAADLQMNMFGEKLKKKAAAVAVSVKATIKLLSAAAATSIVAVENNSQRVQRR